MFIFDNHFILRALDARKISPSLIMTGCKIYQMSVKNDERFAKLIFRV